MPQSPARHLIPRAKLFGNPERTMVRLSPDASSLSWLAPKNGVLNVFIAPLGRLEEARAVTNDTRRGIRMYGWSIDGSRILYLQDVGGDEDWHIYASDPAGGREIDLTPYPKTAARWLGQSVERPGTLAVGLNDRDPRWHDVYLLDLRSGKRELVMRNEEGFGSFTLDRSLQLRIAEKPRAEGGRIVYRINGTKHEPWLTIDHEDDLTTGVDGFTADGKTLYLISSLGRDKAGLFSVDWTSGRQTLLYEHTKADAGRTLDNPRTYVAEAAGAHHLKTEWHLLGPALKADFAVLEKALGPDFDVLHRPLDDRRWIVSAVDPVRPGRYHLYDREKATVSYLFDSRPDLADEKLAKLHPVVLPTRDGLELVCYLTLPAAIEGKKPSRPLPLVLTVHGGPWAQDMYGYDPEHQWLADRGYAVLSVNFRGSTGYGKSFLNAGDGEWAGRMHDDLIDAVEWAIGEGIADRSRIAIMGGSYGGYATLVGLTFTPDVFACGVDLVGPSNLETLLATVPPYWAAFFENLARRVGDPRTEEGRALLRDRSPLHRADRIRRPLLIGQGANDPRVKQAEADQIVQAMKAKSIPVTYVLYPDEGHGFARPENRLSFYAIAEAFLAGHLGGAAEPITDEIAQSTASVSEGAGGIHGLGPALAKKLS